MTRDNLKTQTEASDRLQQAREKRAALLESNLKTARGLFIGILAMAAICFVTCVGILMDIDSSEPPAAKEKRARCSTSIDAFTSSQKLVRRILRSPSTAEFPSHRAEGVEVEEIECGRYRVHAYVDASNVFGAMIRSPYTALLVFDPKDNSWSGKLESFDE
ncbi:hypothetical protein K2X89_04695 [Myxococcota bacterium]|nr:hypothetical protein [Myxococcota bacterium]